MPADVLFEIGCEEIPAKMLARALADLPALVEARLAAARLAHHGIRTLGTPRRLAVIVKQLADRQPDLHEEVVGPPVSAAFAADGTLTRAGQGFAAKNGVAPDALVKREVAGKKGLYAVAIRSAAGRDARALLPELLVGIAGAIAWPKSQRWGWGETAFVRPVQWLVALLGGEVVPLAWAGVSSGRHSRGHRFLANRRIEIASPDGYADALRAAHVVVDPDARRDLVRAELARLERETGLRVRPDDELLAEVIHLGEYPVGVSGAFDPSFLEVPEELIVTEMRNHQRYFAMEDAGGKLANRFATMMATVVKDPAVVQRGNEYVIASRLSDAKFFFAEDRKKSFEQWNEKLASVVFQAKLGDRARTIGHKVARIKVMVTALAPSIQEAAGGVNLDTRSAIRAAELCKADLASSVVGEFPELQGVMGRYYARFAGEGATVATAIEEHYYPKGQGGSLPRYAEGALISIADKIDTIYGCIAVGLVPTGSADPLGLRRAAIGIIAILLDRGRGGANETRGWPTSFGSLIELAGNTFATHAGLPLTKELFLIFRNFFRERLRGVLIGEGFSTRHVDAVLAVSDSPSDARARAKAVAAVPDAACQVFKRIANILDQSHEKGIPYSGFVDERLFVEQVERDLWNAWRVRQPTIGNALDSRKYDVAFHALVGLGPTVAAFLGEKEKGGVMVIDPSQPEISGNRLSLLDNICDPYAAFVDFRLLGGAS